MQRNHSLRLPLIAFLLVLLFAPVASGTRVYAQGGDNCAVLPEQILGQANIGFAGAANIGFAGALGDEIQSNDWDLEGADLVSEMMAVVPTGNEAVALIIVDDFSSDEPVDAADWADASHGWLVQEVFNRMLDALPEATRNLITVELLDVSDEEIAYRSGNIATALEAMMDSLNADSGISRFVVNMSFVFVGCESTNPNFDHAQWIQNRQNNPNLTLVEATGGNSDLVEDILSNPQVVRADDGQLTIDESRGNGQGNPPQWVQEQLAFLSLFELAQMNNDPLRDLFRDRSDYIIIPVASAGNFKWRRPFYPAQWTEVVSVAATLGGDDELWSQSNFGSISAPGAYFLFDDEVYRAGTSFAAPVVSTMSALDLTNSTPICGVGNNGRPVIAGNARVEDEPEPFLDVVSSDC